LCLTVQNHHAHRQRLAPNNSGSYLTHVLGLASSGGLCQNPPGLIDVEIVIQMSHAFIIYSRRGCHLCDEMWDELHPMLRGRDADLKIIDVDTDAELKARYGTRIPVLSINGVELCSGRLDQTKVLAYLSPHAPNSST